ncbi:MAG: hemerythrin protein [Sphingomonas bacterium]|nr:hemerythrin protein [Sphingomonas bacterium]
MLDRLKQDHRRIEALADRLESMLAEPLAPEAGLTKVRWALAREVLRHSAAEERQLYRPLRRAHPDDAGHRVESSEGFQRLVRDHFHRWDGHAVASGWREYGVAARALLVILRGRIRHEETRIFPRAEACC